MTCDDSWSIDFRERRLSSAMSWGDDEIERETSQKVAALFQEIDRELYEEEDQIENSEETKEELRDWKRKFPHLRLRGSTSPVHRPDAKKVFQKVFNAGKAPVIKHKKGRKKESDSSDEFDVSGEEVLAEHGSYRHSVTADFGLVHSRISLRRRTLSAKSRSTDTKHMIDVKKLVKENVQERLFQKMWSELMVCLRPSLEAYGSHVLQQSVDYVSISRESSGRGLREEPQPATSLTRSISLDAPLSQRLSPKDVNGALMHLSIQDAERKIPRPLSSISPDYTLQVTPSSEKLGKKKSASKQSSGNRKKRENSSKTSSNEQLKPLFPPINESSELASLQYQNLSKSENCLRYSRVVSATVGSRRRHEESSRLPSFHKAKSSSLWAESYGSSKRVQPFLSWLLSQVNRKPKIPPRKPKRYAQQK